VASPEPSPSLPVTAEAVWHRYRPQIDKVEPKPGVVGEINDHIRMPELDVIRRRGTFRFCSLDRDGVDFVHFFHDLSGG
jgi:hypothetical protein